MPCIEKSEDHIFHRLACCVVAMNRLLSHQGKHRRFTDVSSYFRFLHYKNKETNGIQRFFSTNELKLRNGETKYRTARMAHVSDRSHDILTHVFGTSSFGNSSRAGSSILIRKSDKKSLYLFDCPDGTLSPFLQSGFTLINISKIFISQLDSKSIHGLVCLLCSTAISGTTPIDIYGPIGLNEYIRAVVHGSQTKIGIKFKVHEFLGLPKCNLSPPPPPISFPPLFYELPTRAIVKNTDGVYEIPDENMELTVYAIPVNKDIPALSYIIADPGKPGMLRIDKVWKLVEAQRDEILAKHPEFSRIEMIYRIFKNMKPDDVYTFPRGQQLKGSDLLGPSTPPVKIVINSRAATSTAAKSLELFGKDADFLFQPISTPVSSLFQFNPTLKEEIQKEFDRSKGTRKNNLREILEYNQITKEKLDEGHSSNVENVGQLISLLKAKQIFLTDFHPSVPGRPDKFTDQIVQQLEDYLRFHIPIDKEELNNHHTNNSSSYNIDDPNLILGIWDNLTINCGPPKAEGNQEYRMNIPEYNKRRNWFKIQRSHVAVINEKMALLEIQLAQSKSSMSSLGKSENIMIERMKSLEHQRAVLIQRIKFATFIQDEYSPVSWEKKLEEVEDKIEKSIQVLKSLSSGKAPSFEERELKESIDFYREQRKILLEYQRIKASAPSSTSSTSSSPPPSQSVPEISAKKVASSSSSLSSMSTPESTEVTMSLPKLVAPQPSSPQLSLSSEENEEATLQSKAITNATISTIPVGMVNKPEESRASKQHQENLRTEDQPKISPLKRNEINRESDKPSSPPINQKGEAAIKSNTSSRVSSKEGTSSSSTSTFSSVTTPLTQSVAPQPSSHQLPSVPETAKEEIISQNNPVVNAPISKNTLRIVKKRQEEPPSPPSIKQNRDHWSLEDQPKKNFPKRKYVGKGIEENQFFNVPSSSRSLQIDPYRGAAIDDTPNPSVPETPKKMENPFRTQYLARLAAKEATKKDRNQSTKQSHRDPISFSSPSFLAKKFPPSHTVPEEKPAPSHPRQIDPIASSSPQKKRGSSRERGDFLVDEDNTTAPPVSPPFPVNKNKKPVAVSKQPDRDRR